jgi:hypothetical protein
MDRRHGVKRKNESFTPLDQAIWLGGASFWALFNVRITQNEYDEKARLLKQQQTEIAARIEQHQTGDDAFRTTLEALVSAASRGVHIPSLNHASARKTTHSQTDSEIERPGRRCSWVLAGE